MFSTVDTLSCLVFAVAIRCGLRLGRFTWIEAPKIGVSKNRGTPKWMVKIMEHLIEMDDLGVPLFLETPKWSWMEDNVPFRLGDFQGCHVDPRGENLHVSLPPSTLTI